MALQYVAIPSVVMKYDQPAQRIAKNRVAHSALCSMAVSGFAQDFF
jgi:hypothetical protein